MERLRIEYEWNQNNGLKRETGVREGLKEGDG